jgi:hypothetical protein
MILPRMILNGNYSNNPHKSLANALNVELNDDFTFLINENGNELVHTFSNKICGVIVTPDCDILFTTDDNEISAIHKLYNDNQSELILYGNFGFRTTHTITGDFTYNSHKELIVCFTDYLSNVRCINIDNPFIGNVNKFVSNEYIPLLDLTPEFKIPTYDIIDISSGGNIKKGTYQLITAYYIGDYDVLNYGLPSKTIPIFTSTNIVYSYDASYYKRKDLAQDISSDLTFEISDHLHVVDGNDSTDNKIVFNITNLDTRFKKLKICVIYRTNTLSTVYHIGDYKITNTSLQVTFNGSYIQEESINDVTIPYKSINKQKTITSQNNALLLANGFNNNNISYQKYANNIKVSYNLDTFNSKHPDKIYDGYSTFKFRGVIPDEVYALYIILINKNGSIYDTYHIPGRSVDSINIASNIALGSYINENDTIDKAFSGGNDFDLFEKGYDDFRENKIFQIMDTSSRAVDSIPATSLAKVLSIDINSNIGIPASMELECILNQFVNSDPYNIVLTFDRGSIPSRYYPLVNPLNDPILDVFQIGLLNGIYPSQIYPGDVVNINTSEDICDIIMYHVNVIYTAYGYTATYLGNNKLKIEASSIYGGFANTIVTSIYITSVLHNTNINFNITSFNSKLTGSNTRGINTNSRIKIKIGSDILGEVYLYPNYTLPIIYKEFEKIIKNNTNHNAVANEEQILVYADTLYGDMVVNNPDYKLSLIPSSTTVIVTEPSMFTGGSYISNFNKLGYWENESEVYPDEDDFDIWDVDNEGDGLPLTIGPDIVNGIATLRNKKVRHHKMPSYINMYSINEDNNKIISLNITNIKFPKDILDKIQGFVIGYASKNSNNMTILGTAPIITNNFKNYNQYNVSDDFIRFSDLNLIKSKTSINNGYLKSIHTFNDTSNKSYLLDINKIRYTDNRVYKVTDVNYVPRNNAATYPSNKGREESLILKLKNPFTLNKEDIQVANICSINTDLFTPFFEQKVVLANDINYVNNNTYIYNLYRVYGFDSILSTNCNMTYIGDQSFIQSEDADDDLLYRNDGDFDDDPTTVVKFYKYKSHGLINAAIRELDQVSVKYFESIKNRVLAWILPDHKLIYRTNFNVDPDYENEITYNYMYNYVNNIKALLPYNPININTNIFPNRIYRSNVQNKENLSIGWRYISVLSYYEIGNKKGYIMNLQGSDDLLIIHTIYSLFLAKLKDRIEYNNEDVYLGQADIFDREPKELLTSNNASLGLQSHIGALLTDIGYCFYNPYSKSIFVYNNQGLLEINNSESNEYFKNNFNNNTEVLSFYDDIVLFASNHTKRKLLIYNKAGAGNMLSYNYHETIKGLVSKHTYRPSFIYENKNGIFSISADGLQIFKEGVGSKGNYFNEQFDSYVDVLFNYNNISKKRLESIGLLSFNDNSQRISSIIVYTQNQVSKEYILLEFENINDWDKIRYVDGMWWYNNIRDYSSDTIVQNIIQNTELNIDSINNNKAWYELSMFENSYFIIRLKCNNTQDVIFKNIECNFINI